MENLIKPTTQTVDGTSFHFHEVRTTVNKLTEIMGEPDFIDPDDKVTYEWVREYKGNVFTVYDWKEYRNFSKDTLIKFHIGGASEEITAGVQKHLKALLK